MEPANDEPGCGHTSKSVEKDDSVESNPDDGNQDSVQSENSGSTEKRNSAISISNQRNGRLGGEQVIGMSRSNLYQCDECERSFTRLSLLRGHKQAKHSRDTSDSEEERAVTPDASLDDSHVCCNQCTRSFSKPSGLAMHMRLAHSSSQGRNHICVKCKKVCKSAASLAAHLKTHTGAAPPVRSYKCDRCDKTFRQKITLTAHIRTKHTGERPFKCSHCDKSFPMQSWRKKHEEQHQTTLQERRRYPCSKCSKFFVSPNYLQRHVLNVHNRRSHLVCSVCGKSFTEELLLEVHLLTHSHHLDLKTNYERNKQINTTNLERDAGKGQFQESVVQNCENDTEGHIGGRVMEDTAGNTGEALGVPLQEENQTAYETSQERSEQHAQVGSSPTNQELLQEDGGLAQSTVESANLLLALSTQSGVRDSCSAVVDNVEIDGGTNTSVRDTDRDGHAASTENTVSPSQKSDSRCISFVQVNSTLSDCEVVSVEGNISGDYSASGENDNEKAEASSVVTQPAGLRAPPGDKCLPRDKQTSRISAEVKVPVRHTSSNRMQKKIQDSDSCPQRRTVISTSSPIRTPVHSHGTRRNVKLMQNGSFKLNEILETRSPSTVGARKDTQEKSTREEKVSESSVISSEHGGEVGTDGEEAEGKETEANTRTSTHLACAICHTTFKKIISLKKHLSLHVSSECFPCNHCDISFESVELLKSHLDEISREIHCPDCGDYFTSRAKLRQHRGVCPERDESGPPYKCNECDRLFKTKGKYENHVDSHGPHACGKCGKSFPSYAKVKMHMKVHGEGDGKACGKCGKVFRSALYLKRHMTAHSAEHAYTCQQCKRTFKYGSSLRKHRRICQSLIEKQKQKELIETHGLQCNICQKTFKNKKCLKYHLALHEPEKPFNCKECGKGFVDKYHYERHMNMHAGVKNFSCHLCGKCFFEKGHLKTHLKKHTGEKNFLCQQCGKGFFEAGQLKRHVETHEGTRKRRFVCQECGKAFIERGHLKEHLYVHYGNKPFKCSICGVGCLRKSDLEVHIKAHRFKKIFPCTVCGKRLSNKVTLNMHMRMHAWKQGKGSQACEVCNKEFSSFTALVLHKKTHAKKRPYKCGTCNRTFVHVEAMQNHLARHSEASKQSEENQYEEALQETAASELQIPASPSVFTESVPCGEVVTIHEYITEGANEELPVAEDGQDVQETTSYVVHNNPIQIVHSEQVVESEELPEANAEEEPPYDDTSALTVEHIDTNPAPTQTLLRLALESGYQDILVNGPPEALFIEGIFENKEKNTIEVVVRAGDDVQADTDVVQVLTEENAEVTFQPEPVIEEEEAIEEPHEVVVDVPPPVKEVKREETEQGEQMAVENGYLIPGPEAPESQHGLDEVAVSAENDKPEGPGAESSVGIALLSRKQTRRRTVTPFQCEICQDYFKRKSVLMRHVKLHLQKKDFQCPECGKCYVDRSALNRHIASHKGKTHACPICGKCFFEKGHCKEHMKIHTVERELYTCKVCKKTLTTEASLHRHERIHTGEVLKNHVCSYCGDAFQSKHHLEAHMRRHTGEKPFSCSVCQRRFAVRSTLTLHMGTHSAGKHFKCTECGNLFKSNKSLKHHMKRHRGELNFLCSVCGKSFMTPGGLQAHSVTHTGEKPYSCVHCNKSFGHLSGFKKHNSSHCHVLKALV